VESLDDLEDRGKLAQRLLSGVRAVTSRTIEVVNHRTRVVSNLQPLVIIPCVRGVVSHSMQ
jgi:hypothetical protein